MKAPTRVGLFGKGRLGRAIATRLGDDLTWQVTHEPPPQAPVEVAIEACSGAVVPQRLEWALANGTPLVIGSTGWSMPDLAERVGRRIGVVTAPNFSLGVALLRRFALVLARFCATDGTLDPYIVEHHQAKKHDAPSGTAKLLAATMLEGCTRKSSWSIGGPLRSDELSVAVVRAGSTYSEHRVGMDAPAEVLELVHTARSAAAFADGALAAARFAYQHKGVFTMDEVAASVLDPLFVGLAGGNA
ncbi:MAG TPA: dihydrodipicolinate reductase C-terminal domain-containing protein [Planctomycetota bacterium]|nr:dihydrodipicolinate reductase C-terminal domain-containing protein [Planctomycetota bacterium]